MTANKEIRIGVRAAIAIAMLAAAFVLPTQASAASCSNSDPTAAQYCSSEVVTEETPPTSPTTTSTPESTPATAASTPAPAAASSGSLPFTGLDLAALIAAAAVLTGTGLALRRISSSGDQKA